MKMTVEELDALIQWEREKLDATLSDNQAIIMTPVVARLDDDGNVKSIGSLTLSEFLKAYIEGYLTDEKDGGE